MTESIDYKGIRDGTRDMKSRAFLPRLMTLQAAADYLGVSYWTMRDYVADGIIPRVTLPCSRRRRKGGVVSRRSGDIEARRIYVDRLDLDSFIEKRKENAVSA